MADLNVNQGNIEKIAQYLQSNSDSNKEVSSKDVESVFNSLSGNGEKSVDVEEYVTTLAQTFLDREIEDIEDIEDDFLAAWEDFAASDKENGKLSSEEIKLVSNLLDDFKESKLPEKWTVDGGVVKEPGGKEVVAADPKDLPEKHTISDDGKIKNEAGEEIGVVAQTEVYDPETGKYKLVESFYLYKEEAKVKEADTKKEKPVSQSELPEGHEITEDGKILDKGGKEIGRIEVTYDDATSDGVNDKITQYFLYEEEPATGLPEGWKQNDDGTITDKDGKTLSPVPADEIDGNPDYTIKDGQILDKDNNVVGQVITSESDVIGADGKPELVQSYYMYDKEDSSLPEGWTKDENGVITDDKGRELTAVDAETIDNGNYEVKDGLIYNEYGQEVGRVMSQDSDVIGSDGKPETVESYYLYNDVPEIEEVQVAPSDLPEGYTITDDGKILDKDGNVFGCVKVTYMDAANGDGIADKVTQYFKYQEVEKEDGTQLPEGWTANEDGSITDDQGRKLNPVDAETIDKGNYEVKDGKIFDENGKEVGRVVSQETDAIAEDGKKVDETVDSYYLYADDPAETKPADGTKQTPPADSEEELPELQAGNDEDAEKSVLTDDAAAQFAKQLYDSTAGRLGTDEQQFKDILNNPDLSSDDWIKIISMYNESYGSFIQDVDADFSFLSGKEDIMNGITSKLLEAAEGGNEEAIALLAKEFHNGTAGMSGTADEFISAFMNSASDEVLRAVMESYSEVNEGENIYDAIKGDFSGKIEDAYIERLNEILAQMRE